MVKKVTAPKTYDPGKGRPKEHLAYLNEREMAYLRSINGNNMERGPRGLPSFPPDDSLGSSSKAGTASGTSTSKTTGAGGQPGAGGQRGAGSNTGPGSGRPGTASGAQQAANSQSAASASRSAQSGYSGPASPMGGQGTSFSRDTAAQQAAQVRDAINAVRSSPSFRTDAAAGGIKSLNVGPMGVSVNVGKTIAPSAARAPEGMYGPRVGISGPGYLGTMSQPGMITSGMPSQYSGSYPGKALPEPDMPLAVRTTRPYDIRYDPRQSFAGETILKVEDVPPNETMVPRSSIGYGIAGPFSRDYEKMVKDVRDIVASKMPTKTPASVVASASAPFRSAASEGLPPGYAERYGVGEFADTVARDENGNPYGPETPSNDYVDNAEPTFTEPPEESPFRITSGRFYEGSPESFANRISDKIGSYVPDFLKGPGGSAGPLAGDNDRGPYRQTIPIRPETAPVVPRRKKPMQPKQYASWDAGQNIPSPQDSDYTLYLKYLQEKAAQKASV